MLALREQVAALGAMIDALAQTAVPEGPPVDEDCPKAAFDEDPVVGKAWRSWCSLG